MKILIIGAAGKVARIIQPALEEAHDCRFFDRQPVPQREDETIVGDILDTSTIAEAVAGMDSVVYLAAGRYVEKPDGYDDSDLAFSINVRGWHGVLDAGLDAGVRHFVYASSLSVFQDHHRTGIDASLPPDGWSPYCITKILGEEVCRVAARCNPDATFIALRLVYPCTTEEWEKREPSEPTSWFHPLGPEDTGKLFLAALRCRQPGAHILNTTGDATGRYYPLEPTKSILGWVPTGN